MAKTAVQKSSEKKKGENAIVRYLRETWFEIRKVSWPTRAEALNLTGIVIAVTVVLAIILGIVMDRTFEWLMGLLFSLAN